MSISLDVQRSQGSVPTVQYDVVVVGAGPYGLSTAAHLMGQGLNLAIFGKSLWLWREHMPKGMFLRSFWWATNLSDPQKKYGLGQYFQAHNLAEIELLPVETFVNYGLWFQKQVIPNIDETYVSTIERKERQFVITLVDGRIVHSSVVIMAPGLYYYIYSPGEYAHLPAELMSHTVSHHVFKPFAGKRLVVIGGGQSALETAALAHEAGAEVDLVSRSPLVWLGDHSLGERRLFERVRLPKAGIAPGWFNWTLEQFPYTFQRLPRSTKDELLLGRGRYGPAGSSWLKGRIEGKVAVHELQRVEKINETDSGVMVRLSNNETLKADHVILGTGYRVDVKQLPMLHPSVVSDIKTYQNAPILNNRFESSVPGLYFVGISSVSSFGPLYRFVVGVEAASRRIASAVARQVAHIK